MNEWIKMLGPKMLLVVVVVVRCSQAGSESRTPPRDRGTLSVLTVLYWWDSRGGDLNFFLFACDGTYVISKGNWWKDNLRHLSLSSILNCIHLTDSAFQRQLLQTFQVRRMTLSDGIPAIRGQLNVSLTKQQRMAAKTLRWVEWVRGFVVSVVAKLQNVSSLRP